MAERLPGGAAKNGKLLSGISIPSDISAMVAESLGSPVSSGEQEKIPNGRNGLLVSNGPSFVRNKASHPKITNNGIIPPDSVQVCLEGQEISNGFGSGMPLNPFQKETCIASLGPFHLWRSFMLSWFSILIFLFVNAARRDSVRHMLKNGGRET
jgi:hypothetical protein